MHPILKASFQGTDLPATKLKTSSIEHFSSARDFFSGIPQRMTLKRQPEAEEELFG